MHTTIVPRRSRKKPRPNSKERSHKKPESQRPTNPTCDDSSLTFLDDHGDFLSDQKEIFTTLPTLLDKRLTGNWKQGPKAWEHNAMKTFIKKPPMGGTRRPWRNFARKTIPFTKLGTPVSDAVLALNRQGSHVLCLGSKRPQSAPLALAIRIYGVPSVSTLDSRKELFATTCTPLLRTVPLLYELQGESLDSAIFNFRREISPATTPVHILISRDWKMGVAMFQPSTVWREEGRVGNLILFSLRRSADTMQTVWQCTNVRLGIESKFTLRNLLWTVDVVPKRTASSDSQCICSLPAYLLFNDEEDGFRLTWSFDGWCLDGTDCHTQLPPSPLDSDSSYVLPEIISHESSWESFEADLLSGEQVLSTNTKPPVGVSVVYEAFLHVDVLLADILSRRKGMSSKIHPIFVYNLVSVLHGGRVAELVITFIRGARPGALGVFVQVDMFTSRYQELDWVVHRGTQSDDALQGWCNTIALNRRMKAMSAGPYSVSSSSAMDWGMLCLEKPFDTDEVDDTNSSIWKEYVDDRDSPVPSKPPKLVAFSSIYPHCDYISNKAITDCRPVKRICCKDSPLELVYG